MEPQPIIPLPPVPKPEIAAPAPATPFKKSKVIVVLAYVSLVMKALSFLLGSLGGFFPSSLLFRVLFSIPALVIIFSKQERSYKIACTIFLIIIAGSFLLPFVLGSSVGGFLFQFLSHFFTPVQHSGFQY